jgi:phosphatidylserine/phosphatidylglycerophosphate/cardiolipin synthase-like enzyme
VSGTRSSRTKGRKMAEINPSKSFEVISTVNAPFSISQALRNGFRHAQKLCVCSPWGGKAFVDLMIQSLPSGCSLNFISQTPKEHDLTFRTLEALENESKKMRWEFEAMCNPYLHCKFYVVDDRDVFFTTANATSGGLYNNIEIMVIARGMPLIADSFSKIFETIWNQRQNQPWEFVRDFSGTSVNRMLVERTRRFLIQKGDSEIHVSELNCYLRKYLFGSWERAKEAIEEMCNAGILYEPCSGYVKLVHRSVD